MRRERTNVYSVGQVNLYIKRMFKEDFLLNGLCVRGEVSNCKYHSTGHIYFTLKDETGTMSAILFAGKRRSGLLFPMKDGDRVLVTGSVEVYERDGKYQLYANSIELDGEGDSNRRFLALKKELEEMGMFAPEYKRPIPAYAKTVGIVTAPTGAAIQDIRNISARRNPKVQLVLYPALVQGEGAAESIVRGIHALEALGVDLIIVGRGGGSMEDLWAFNETEVAYAIFHSQVPIISAVGHETDWTIADYVADLRAPTPSAAAELAVFDLAKAREDLMRSRERMMRRMQEKMDLARTLLWNSSLRLKAASPKERLIADRSRLSEMKSRLETFYQGLYKEKRYQLTLLAQRLEGNSPVKRLSEGYAYVENEAKKSVRSVEEVRKKDRLWIFVMDGIIEAEVTEVSEYE